MNLAKQSKKQFQYCGNFAISWDRVCCYWQT